MKSDFKEGRWGDEFKDGKLYQFTARHVLVMVGGENPCAWLKRRSHNWHASRKWADSLLNEVLKVTASAKVFPAMIHPEALPSGQLIFPGLYSPDRREEMARRAVMEQRQRAAFEAFLKTVPPAILTELRRYQTRQWNIYSVLARCPGAMDLSHSNPALLFALASNWVFHKPAVQYSMRAVRSLVNKKQKTILGWLGFPATEPVRWLLHKVDPGALSVQNLLSLRAALSEEGMLKSMAHFPRLNAGMIRLMCSHHYRRLVTPRLLTEMAEDVGDDRQGDRVTILLMDAVNMARMDQDYSFPGVFSSLKRLKEVHDELAERVRPPEPDDLDGSKPFPCPPFMGTETIRPIMTADDLYLEGQEMHHCVGSYAYRVLKGYEYIYRILAPVRATLSICRSGSQWVKGEISQTCNKPVASQDCESILKALFMSRRTERQDLESDNTVRIMLGKDEEQIVDLRQLPLMTPEMKTAFLRVRSVFDVPNPAACATEEAEVVMGCQAVQCP